MDTTIRNLDEKAYRRLKAKAAVEGITVGTAVSQAIESWLEEGKARKKNVSLMDMKPEPFGKKNARLSEEIDEILYAGG
jgi:plasmid stability protein